MFSIIQDHKLTLKDIAGLRNTICTESVLVCIYLMLAGIDMEQRAKEECRSSFKVPVISVFSSVVKEIKTKPVVCMSDDLSDGTEVTKSRFLCVQVGTLCTI